MCQILQDRIVFTDGSVILYENLELENLTKKQLEELQEANASKLDILFIRKNLHGLRIDIQKLINKEDIIRQEQYKSNEMLIKKIQPYALIVAMITSITAIIIAIIK